MNKLKFSALPAEDQHNLCHLVANIAPARQLLRRYPTSLILWQIVLLGLAAEQQLWCANLRLVLKLARQVAKQTGGDADELFQEGCLSLRQAIRSFHPDFGCRLSTYAYQAILRRLWQIDTSGHWVTSSRHARRQRQVALANGQAPIGLSSARVVSATVLDFLPDPRDQFAEIDSPSIDFLELLDPRSSEILRMRFGIGCTAMTLQEAAQHYGVAPSTIYRWERRALHLAREILTSERTVSREFSAAENTCLNS